MSFLLFQNISCYCLSCKASAKAMILDISKHLMLLFIQYRKVAEHEYFIISKHLMLLFIELMRMKNENPNLFQNISCYCLSLLHDPKYGCVHHFKTSHVIVYQVEIRGNVGHVLFQNISCYCLSISQPSEVRAVILFQNISCYCLSALGGC